MGGDRRHTAIRGCAGRGHVPADSQLDAHSAAPLAALVEEESLLFKLRAFHVGRQAATCLRFGFTSLTWTDGAHLCERRAGSRVAEVGTKSPHSHLLAFSARRGAL